MRLNRIAAALLCTAMVWVSAAAQTPNLLRVARVSVKPDHINEFTAIQKEYTAAYKKSGTWRLVYRTLFGSTNEYTVVSPLNSFGEMDGKSPLVKSGMSETDVLRLATRYAECLETIRVTIEKRLLDVAVPAAAGSPMPKYIRVVRVRAKHGMVDDYIAVLKSDITPAIKKAGSSGFLARQVLYGGTQDDVTVRTPMEKLGELDSDSMVMKALGADGFKKFRAKVDALTATSEYLVYTYEADLSNSEGVN